MFFENQSFFPSLDVSLPATPVLLHFVDLTPPINRFKSGLVYERRRLTLPLPEPSPPSEPAQTESFTGDPTTTQVPRHSTRVSHPSNRYGFSLTSLHATLSSILILSSYSEVAKHDCWQATMTKYFKLFRIIIHRMLSLVLLK